MAKCRIGHFAEAQILQELGVDYIDESEVLTPADEAHHVEKHAFKTPFVCGARNLGEAFRRIAEGAAMIRTKGEAGTGDVVHAVKHIGRSCRRCRILTVLGEEELYAKAKEHQAPYELVRMVAEGRKVASAKFLRRRNRHAGGRRSCYAIGRRSGIRRFGHLHEGFHHFYRSTGGRKAGESHRSSGDALQ